MTKVIAEYEEVAILEDDAGKFLFSRNDDIVELPQSSKLPLMNVHANIPVIMSGDVHRTVRAMLS